MNIYYQKVISTITSVMHQWSIWTCVKLKLSDRFHNAVVLLLSH